MQSLLQRITLDYFVNGVEEHTSVLTNRFITPYALWVGYVIARVSDDVLINVARDKSAHALNMC